jgi:hypothetical protein
MKTGKDLQVTYTPLSVLEEKYIKDPDDFMNYLRLMWEQGFGTVGEVLDNDKWPEWNPKKVLDILD